MEKMLSTHFKDSPVKLQIMSGFTLLCSTNVGSIVLLITGLTLKFNSEIVEVNETQAPVSWILL